MLRLALAVLTSAILAAAASGQTAAEWPARPVTFVVPFPAGSATDLVARVVARDLAARLGQPVLIDNRAGADGTIGTRAVAKAAPDGYTLSFATPSAYVAAPYVYSKLAYDPVVDLVPVSLVGRTPYVLAVYPGLGVKTVSELVALAKSKPGALNFSSVGEGSIAHVGMLVFAEMTGIALTHIPYKSTAQSIIDVSTGVIQMQLASIPPTVSLYESGMVRLLAVAGPHRVPLLKSVPTMAEEGFANFEQTFWLAVFAPAGTPAEIIARLNREIAAGLRTDEVAQALAAQGVEPQHSTPAALGEIVRADIASYRETATKAGVKRH